MYQSSGKRFFDIFVASFLMVVLSPILLVVAILVRINLGGPILFKQQRPGKDGLPFTLCKFRTMVDLYDKDGKPLSDSERLVPFGRLLRKTSLDELPELWNVIKGDMSLVGPRPLLMRYLDRYTPEQNRRHLVRPGITGWAQINGRNAISWEEKFNLDIWYVSEHNLALDLKILWFTIFRTLKREGISQKGHDTMEEFLGSTR